MQGKLAWRFPPMNNNEDENLYSADW